jgi:hypothetical protein
MKNITSVRYPLISVAIQVCAIAVVVFALTHQVGVQPNSQFSAKPVYDRESRDYQVPVATTLPEW